MITVSEPIVRKISKKMYSVEVVVTNTNDDTQTVLGTKSININITQDDDAIAQLQPFIDQATNELLKEQDDIANVRAQFDGFKDAQNSAIASKVSVFKSSIGKVALSVVAFLLMASNCFGTTTDKIAYAASAAITCTLSTPLANSSTVARTSTAVDNTANLYDDAIVTTKIMSGSGAPASDKAVYVYLYGSDGTTYESEDGGSPATDANLTLNSPTVFRLATVIPVNAANTTYTKTFTVANAFGGVMPPKWGIIVLNTAGQSLNTTAGNFNTSYVGVTYTNN